MPFRFDNSFVRALPGTYLRADPAPAPDPSLVALNLPLARRLGLDEPALMAGAADWISGAKVPLGAEPATLAYAGHQFGGFSPQLGDGRAHLLGEHLGPDGRRWDIQLKGSGRTAFSRGGDGKAALGPMLREFLVSEAMAACGIPTTQILGVARTGEMILRDKGLLPGAVAARVAASHIRVGTFQFFAARGEVEKLRALTDYTLARHFAAAPPPDSAPSESPPALRLWDAVMERQVALIAQWMGVGFVHGVMNTDNMALSGETIDYGPCAFLDAYVPDQVFSSIDRGGRYAYANQPAIAGWNLARLAEALLPLIDPDEARAIDLANDRLDRISPAYDAAWQGVLRAKLGLSGPVLPDDGDLAAEFLAALAQQGADWTLSFHALSGLATSDAPQFDADAPLFLRDWLPRWRARLAKGGDIAAAIQQLRQTNPAVIPRNHLVEAALTAAEAADMAPFEALLAAVRDPFGPVTGREVFAAPPPAGAGGYVTFCGT